ncbi:hypothetical protein ST201phi2-1p065 [Pseudomonas phage 201phi2-1]|uniref:Uncharacterized protein n=1 Tax=Pseudomonas phage 201phi2-1 TaxID=198110 RepID=B3FK40_BP201|nr:hypothetical protein ST201phi2-1p065 [Pseudomonas phage 201phi2-1]ABY62898.1 hypothetical protein 201phi2-1p065 [Pseudomonas phage 201phi2-1]
MSSWAASWGLNGLLVLAVLYLFAFAASKNKRVLHIALVFFLGLAMYGTLPADAFMCR